MKWGHIFASNLRDANSWRETRTTLCVELTFHSPLRRHLYQHPIANADECNMSGGESKVSE
jgi:hypothetical protein